MNSLQSIRLWFVFSVLIALVASSVGDSSIADDNFPIIITDVYATGYYCVYDSELAGSQTITKTISNVTYTLKPSFLFGGFGVAMQGTGRTAPDGDYIKYTGGAGCFVYIAGPNAGKNLDGQWVVSPSALRNRYARLGITNFTGFGNLALLFPDRATFSVVSSITGYTGQTLTPWQSIAVDPSLIPLGQTGALSFKNDHASLYDAPQSTFRADDVGYAIKGKHIDIYLGEGQAAYDNWLQSGGNRFVDVFLDASPQLLAHSF